jgi:alkanesulfonate monooxygenase SsuD/methylene tetrahydromethanopterin reductase-like flavin-dependent oxidoreductase (luciferase family)
MKLAQLLFTGVLEPDGSHDPLQTALDYAMQAEALGWDEVWTTEHNFNPHVVNPCAVTLAAYLLAQTQQLTIGTGVVVLPHTHPARLAAQVSLLQHLSGDRLRLGVGRGSQTLELSLFGRGVDAWQSGFPQALGELKRLLDSGQLKDGVPFVPPPRPTPMVVAATSPATVAAAAQHNLPFIVAFPFPDAFKAQLLDAYQQTAAACGHETDAPHWLSVVVHFARSRELALQELRQRFVPWNLRAARATPFLAPPSQQLSEAQWEDVLALQGIGTAEDIAERLSDLIQLTGSDRLLVVADGTLEPSETLANMTRLVTEVMPMLGQRPQQQDAVMGSVR